jgi:hypothetical protein
VGGIGSYKLYVMIGYVIHLLQEHSTQNDTLPPAQCDGRIGKDFNEEFLFRDCGTDEGMCLLAFFKYFGQARNFNTSTVLRVRGAEATFDRTNLVKLCQEMFAKAYKVLLMAMSEGPSRALALEKDRTGSRKFVPSKSILALLLLNVEDFVSLRNRRGLRCRQAGPLLSDADKDTKGRAVLFELQQWQHKIQASAAAVDAKVTHEDVKRIDPFLWEQIRAFPSSSAVLQHLKSQLQRATIQLAKEQRKQRVSARIAASMNYRDEYGDGGRQNIKKGKGSQRKVKRRDLDPHNVFHSDDFKDEYSGNSGGKNQKRNNIVDGQTKKRGNITKKTGKVKVQQPKTKVVNKAMNKKQQKKRKPSSSKS